MGLALVLAFLVVPVVEIYVIIQVGQVIGPLPTVALLIVESLIGAWIVKREGRRAWAALTGAAGTGRMPASELADAGLVLVGGTLLLTPGFVTDVFGFLFVLPVTRPLARRFLAWYVARRAVRVVATRTGWQVGPVGPGGPGRPGRPGEAGWPGGTGSPGDVPRSGPVGSGPGATPPRVVPGGRVDPPEDRG